MKKFLVKYPAVLKWLYPKRKTRFKNANIIYLTFDDGPVPEVTTWVLDLLKNFNAKATFFCIGDNVQKHPDIFRRIIAEGHTVGNHTYNHLNGWKTSTLEYIKNTFRAEEIMNAEAIEKGKSKRGNDKTKTSELRTTNFKFFRPPYGKIKNSQARKLSKAGYTIVMWDIISYDFNRGLPEEECLQNVLKFSREGSIVVFHDSRKAFKNLKKVLPKVLEYFSSKGYKFSSI
ncbi:polysaccharide deacetylase family protein [Zunongwangia sp. F363]|uniref:Polysaccharide deacetylase family protein n=1 Tax=Autumnicola tepida TaxID=3075595 RepID=A0ABU3CAM6_9FLAO|nr:polysaccharide deacetylase family protein [Zunongwangia sp. F363]MDT0643400.1 polysaccharide deacetylase family protein [Zunongwangia sp. F363]